ncbi:MAG: hypothetical protein ACRDIU_06545 [Actinomycetota bacterium]
MRLIVRRVPPTPGNQLALFSQLTYHAFITYRTGEMLQLEASHRAYAEIENTIRDLEFGMGLNHFLSGRFGTNAAWLTLSVIAHNLARWTSRIGVVKRWSLTKKTRRRFCRFPDELPALLARGCCICRWHWP